MGRHEGSRRVPGSGDSAAGHGGNRKLETGDHTGWMGWVTLTVLGTVVTLWPTVLRTRIADGAIAAARRALPIAGTGLLLVAVGVLAWWRAVAVGGLALIAVATVIVIRPAVRAAQGKPPASFAAWSLTAAAGWLLVAIAIDATILATAAGPDVAVDRFSTVLVPLLVGFAAQILVGALTYLLPSVFGGGPARVRATTAALERHWPQRVSMANAALAVFMLPVGPYVRITTSPESLMTYANFMADVGSIKQRPAKWQDMFFPEIHGVPGN